MYVCYEYLWLDIKEQIRSKTKVLEGITDPEILPPEWNFDASSAGDRPVTDSEEKLYPKKLYHDPIRGAPHKLVICENPTNPSREAAREVFSFKPELEPMFGLEQEFMIYSCETGKLLGWPKGDESFPPCEDYYCSVGSRSCFDKGREYVEKVMQLALKCGLGITGFNWEVAPGQGEFQVCGKGIRAADDLIILRYLLKRVGEEYNYVISFDCKPFENLNGSGLHTNYSTKPMREDKNGLDLIYEAIYRLEATHSQDQRLFGKGNCLRLTGKHETSSIAAFTWGIGDRTASIRIPRETEENRKGYFEDRRPGANADPYEVTSNMFFVASLESKMYTAENGHTVKYIPE